MKKLLLTVLIGLGAISNASAVEGNAEAGKAKSAMCIACHGADGNSAVPMYPNLAGQGANYIAKQLKDFKQAMTTGGKSGRVDPVMGGMTMALSEQDMADLGAYFAAQTPKENSGEGNTLGEKLYFGGDATRGITACIACHGVDGKGMDNAGFPSLVNQSSTYIKSQLMKFRDGSRNNDSNQMMQNIALKFEDADIEALTAYIDSLK